ncbi:MAG: hypothetical protein Q9209_000170 [Squamulea sp. 1 TL-2023]
MPANQLVNLDFSISEDLVPSTNPIYPSRVSINFDGLLAYPLLLQNDPTKCGGQLWPGGMVLAKYVLRTKMIQLQGRTILELGAGSGLVGLALSLHHIQPSSIYLTDLPPILPLLEHNIALNPSQMSVTAHVVEWGSLIPAAVPSSPEILLAADCVYFEPAFPLLLQTMQEIIGPSTICYFCFKKRRRADMRFVQMARKVFTIKNVEDDPDKEVWSREDIHFNPGRQDGSPPNKPCQKSEPKQYLDIPPSNSFRTSLDDNGSIYSADNENERQRGRLLAPSTLHYHPVSPASAQSQLWRARWNALWLANKGLLLVLLSQLFGALMNVTTRLLETSDSPLNTFQYLPLAEATVITFLAPIVACWACSVLIHELFTGVEQIAGLVSLLGVILIARPTSFFSLNVGETPLASAAGDAIPATNATTNPQLVSADHVTSIQRLIAIGVALIGVLGAACAYTTIRMIGQRAHPLISVNYFAAWTTFVAATVLLFAPGMDFQLPSGLRQWSLLVFLGVCGFVMQVLLTAGLSYEKSSRATNMVYTNMLFALAFDKLVFDTTMGTLSILGSSLILGSALYIAVKQDPSKKPKSNETSERDEEVGLTLLEGEYDTSMNEERGPLRRAQGVQLRTTRV